MTVSVVEAAEFAPGVTAPGENPQEAPAGNPEHANCTGWLKPPDPATDSIKAADCPEVTVADGGAAETAKFGVFALVPEPDNAIWCGEPPALSVITICPEREPIAAGVNTTEIEQLAPAATLPAQLFVWAKSAAFAPEIAMLLIDSPLFPVLSNVTAKVGLATPTD